jgi:hypothetical protein
MMRLALKHEGMMNESRYRTGHIVGAAGLWALFAAGCVDAGGSEPIARRGSADYVEVLGGTEQSLSITTPLSARINAMFTGESSCLSVAQDGADTVRMAHCDASAAGRGQAWRVAPSQAAGSYTLSTTIDGATRCLDIVNDGINDRLVLAQCAYVSGQLWQLADAPYTGYVQLKTQFTGPDRCVDITNDGVNTEVRMVPCGNYSGQYWQVNALAASTPVCQRDGCSGQLCVAAPSERMTTCEYRPEYACYRTASCAVQADGACGWTLTRELTGCLLAARASEAPPAVVTIGGSGSSSSSGSSGSTTAPGFAPVEEQSVQIGSPIPAGWVIVRPNGGNSIIIRNVNGAATGAEHSVMVGSPIPAGWVIVRPNGAGSTIIKNLNGAPAGTEQSVVLGSPIPDGWVIVRPNGSNANLIRKS